MRSLPARTVPSPAVQANTLPQLIAQAKTGDGVPADQQGLFPLYMVQESGGGTRWVHDQAEAEAMLLAAGGADGAAGEAAENGEPKAEVAGTGG